MSKARLAPLVFAVTLISSVTPAPAPAENPPPSVESELRWAERAVRELEYLESSRADLGEMVLSLEGEIEKLQAAVPPEPRVEEFVTDLEGLAERVGLTLEVTALDPVEHGNHWEQPLRLTVGGDEASIDAFAKRVPLMPRTIRSMERGASEDGAVFETGIYWFPAPDPEPRSCRPLASLSDAEQTTTEARERLTDLCHLLDAGTDVRRLAMRKEALQEEISVIADLTMKEHGPPDAEEAEDIDSMLQELMEGDLELPPESDAPEQEPDRR